jgi:hypothetical protein
MLPIEAMAKAHWADSEDTSWENLLPEDRDHMVKVMRAALLALAEAEIQEELTYRAVEAFDEEHGTLNESLVAGLRAMLKAIAEAK